MTEQQNIAPQPEVKYHTSINTLPLNKFIDVVVDGNLSALTISGYPSEGQLKEAWVQIEFGFNDAIGGLETDVYVQLLKDTAIISTKMTMASVLIEMLQKVYYEKFANELNLLFHTNVKLEPSMPEIYQKELKKFETRAKSFKIDYDLKMIELENIKSKHETENAPYTREYFHSVLITISDHAKYAISDTITVYEYCERIRRWNSYCEQKNKNG